MIKKDEQAKQFNTSQLSEDQVKDYHFVKRRIDELKRFREQEHYGLNLQRLWSNADRDYIPHRLKTTGKVVVAQDETLGWRGNMVTLGSNQWQSDITQANPFIKIQTALSILIDQNPTGVFTATSKKYSATSELMKQLYQRSWEFAKSKAQLKMFVFNLAKYGWSVGRTYPLRIERKVKVPKSFDMEHPEDTKYEEKTAVEYNDIMRECLDVRNTWIDDMARPNQPYSIKDWAFRKVYSWQGAKEEFGKYKLWDNVRPGGIITETLGLKGPDKKVQDKKLVEVYFYENRLKDLYMVLINDVPVIIAPLPVSDEQGNKKLTLWQTYWNIRHAESPYGIGIYEAIRFDQAMLDRIRNMTLDQLTLSIYKMFFYQGTNSLSETGDINISPGVGKQVLDPKNIQFLEIKGPGTEAWEGMKVMKKDVDDASGITDPLMGQITGKTAFELAQAKEAALKRLKDPLDNIEEALNTEAYITVTLIQQLYSIPETYKIADKQLIQDYLKEVQGDPELYGRKNGQFIANVYREFPLNLEKDEKDNLISTQETSFFRIKPRFLSWEGIINIKSQSLLTPSKQIDKALELEMYNMLIPLLGNPPQIFSKIAKSIVKLYDKDPRDVLPDEWLQDPAQLQAQQAAQQQQQQQDQPLIIPQGQGNAPPGPNPAQPGAPGQPQSSVGGSATFPSEVPKVAERLTTRTKLPDKPVNLSGRIVSRAMAPYRKA